MLLWMIWICYEYQDIQRAVQKSLYAWYTTFQEKKCSAQITTQICVFTTSNEVGILPGITQKCNMRSNIHWFTEFCNSQWLSHFAAFFIVAWTEISVAENCFKKRNLMLKKKRWFRKKRCNKASSKFHHHPRVTTWSAPSLVTHKVCFTLMV